MLRAGTAILSIAFAAALTCRADLADDFHKIEGGLDDALLDSYSGTTVSTVDVAGLLDGLKPYIRGAEALQLVDVDKEVCPPLRKSARHVHESSIWQRWKCSGARKRAIFKEP